jgi:hypothetical protein
MRFNPGIQYYINAIKQVNNYDNIYVSSDSLDHEFVKFIKDNYLNVNVIDYDEVKTIQFGSTCKYIILTDGTFSWTIGCLAFFAESVFYPEKDINKLWCGDIYKCIKEWTEVKYLSEA